MLMPKRPAVSVGLRFIQTQSINLASLKGGPRGRRKPSRPPPYAISVFRISNIMRNYIPKLHLGYPVTKDRVPITCADTLGPKALGGGPLVGTKLVRVIYADESGVSPQD